MSKIFFYNFEIFLSYLGLIKDFKVFKFRLDSIIFKEKDLKYGKWEKEVKFQDTEGR